MKKQLQGSRKPAQGTKGGVVAFGCDKSADLMSKSVEKVEIWPKRHLKYERTRVWKCKTAVYGIARSVVDPQDTNCNFCSGLMQPGADTARKTFGIFELRKCIIRKYREQSLFEESRLERSHFRF